MRVWHLFLQVISGGNYDVDCFITDPLDNVLYNERKKQYDSFSHTTAMKGVYKVCFGNEFSTFSHKTVYLEFRHGNEKPLLQSMTGATALTQVSLRTLIRGSEVLEMFLLQWRTFKLWLSSGHFSVCKNIDK